MTLYIVVSIPLTMWNVKDNEYHWQEKLKCQFCYFISNLNRKSHNFMI